MSLTLIVVLVFTLLLSVGLLVGMLYLLLPRDKGKPPAGKSDSGVEERSGCDGSP